MLMKKAFVFSLLVALAGCGHPQLSHPDGSDAGTDAFDAGADGVDENGDSKEEGCQNTSFFTRIEAQKFRFQFPGYNLQVEFRAENIVRLLFLPQGENPQLRPSWVVSSESDPVTVEIAFSPDCQQVQLTSSRLKFSAAATGDISLSQQAADSWEEFFHPFSPPQNTAQGGQQIELAADDEHLYGLGEKLGSLDRRGGRFEFRNTDPLAGGTFTPQSDPIYQSVPFLIGLRQNSAYGLYLDNTYRLVFDLGKTDPERYRLSAADGELDFYLLAGPRLSDVLAGWRKLVGPVPLPPRWTLGFHQCRWSYYPASRVLEIAREFRTRRIPADGLWLDIDYMNGFRSFTWDAVGFPDPAALAAELSAQGFKLTAIVDPGLKADPDWDIYQQGLAGGHFLKDQQGNVFISEVWPGAAVFPDFSSPAARAWWAGLVPRLTSAGVWGLWIDMNEPATFLAEHNHTVPDQIPAAGDGLPTTMAEVHNVYALLMARATHQGARSALEGRRPFLLSRSGFAGLERYSAMWTGDAPSTWETMRGQLPLLLNIGLSGQPFCGSDVGGFSGGPTPELFARWLQLGAISPFFRDHVQTGAPAQEPWAFGLEVEDISREIISLRYRLLPYLYSLLERATRSGEPLLAPLVFHFQQDEQTHRLDDQAMLGPWLLAAPVLSAGMNERSVYFPGGNWYELRSSRRYTGPGRATVSLKLAALPLFVKEGAILPLGPAYQWSDQGPLDPFEFYLYPAAQETTFELYQDDGTSLAYEQGQFSRVVYRLQRTATGARFSSSAPQGAYRPPPRRLLVHLRPVTGGVDTVKLEGTELSRKSSLSELSAADGWYLDAQDVSLAVSFTDRDGFLLEAVYTSSDDPPTTVSMPFEVEVPPGSAPGEEIYIAASCSGWQHIRLGTVDQSGRVKGNFEVPRGEWFEYKYTRGDWSTVEKWTGCVEATNRYAFGVARPTKTDRVEAWADQCP